VTIEITSNTAPAAFQINGGSWNTGSDTFYPGDTVIAGIYAPSADNPADYSVVEITIGGVSGTFTVFGETLPV